MSRRFAISAALGCAIAMNAMATPALAQEPKPEASADKRIEVLEQRIRDLQAVVGTLQTFVRDGGGAQAPGALPPAAGGVGGGPSDTSIRLLALETQIKALTGQMKDVLGRLDQPGNVGTETPPAPWQQGTSDVPPAPPGPASPFNQPAAAPTPQFGAVTQQPAPSRSVAPGQLPGLANLPSTAGGPRAIYDAAYQRYAQEDLSGAEQGFRRFVSSYPDNPLAGNAYYWLGQSHYKRQQYEPAAKAFLAGYKNNKQSDIAPDSLLHLGMSLTALNEKEAACSTLSAVPRQYPNAAPTVLATAAQTMKKAGCQ